MAGHSSTSLSRPDGGGRSRWLAAFLVGLVLLLALLIASWFLRACMPADPTMNLSTFETPAPPAPAPHDPTPALKAALEGAQADERLLKSELAALSANLRNAVAQCKPVEAKPAPPPPPPPPKPAPQAPLPADRWANKDLGMLQGCWRLGQDTQGTIAVGGRTQRCAIRAGRICFGANGRGEREATANCPGTGTVRCSAPLTARFGNDDTLGTTQPVVTCAPGSVSWAGPPNSLTCRRVSDTLAVCRDRLNFEHEFRRE